MAATVSASIGTYCVRHAPAPEIDVRFTPARPVREFAGTTMGTSWRVIAVRDAGFDDVDLHRALDARLGELVAQLSHWDARSALSRFNRADAGQWVALPPDFCQVLACALELARATGGAFDPAAGALVGAWGFGPHAARRAALPSAARIEAARQRSGWTRIEFDAQRARARQSGGVGLDFSGIAKGYAVDQLAALLRRFGIVDALVEIGGELRALGCRADGRPWQVAIATPASLRAPRPPIIGLAGRAIATSGDQWHAWSVDARRYSHTIDPRSGWPVDETLACVTVVHEECMRADALATALLVLGPQAGVAFAREHGLNAAFVQREPGGGETLRVTAGFGQLLR